MQILLKTRSRASSVDDADLLKGATAMMHVSKLAMMITAVIWATTAPTGHAQAQQRLVFKVSAENTSYVQQHLIDVGDVSGHQVRIFEIHRTYPAKEAPVINGQKIVESWSRGFSDYTSNNGEGTTYAVYVLENGDKFFTKGSLVALQKPESPYLSAWVVGPILGGTGALARINGMSRVTGTANPQAGTNEMQVDLEYWIPE
jgi:hypothetical protein